MANSVATYEDGKGDRAKKHVIGADGFTLCGRLGSNDHGSHKEAQRVPIAERCKRPGCKQGWPDFRADNTLWPRRTQSDTEAAK